MLNGKKLKIRPDENCIDWEYFQILYEIEKLQPTANKLCPKLTDSHIFIKNNSFLKMRVSLATQVFSKSVARRLRFYKAYEVRLENSESTSDFCEKMNDMFDALNRTTIESALRLDSDDLRILRESLEWLDAWKNRVNQNLIDRNEFLTPETSEGLRMTLSSTLDLAVYLLKDLKLEYVMSGRINQDALEEDIFSEEP